MDAKKHVSHKELNERGTPSRRSGEKRGTQGNGGHGLVVYKIVVEDRRDIFLLYIREPTKTDEGNLT